MTASAPAGGIAAPGSIFRRYYEDVPLVDRFAGDPRQSVDVVIPVYHTNELWRANLLSIYREVPVRRLLISDGGCISDGIDIVRRFPRVEVFDHRHYKTLGKCVAELISQVTADWFLYLHSDVFLPEGWFDTMTRHQGEYDWFGCPMNITVMVDYRLERPERPYAGSQMGRKAAFMSGLDTIEDDYVYRQEDFVFKRLVENNGFREGKIEDTFHYHQLMFRPSPGFDLRVRAVNVDVQPNETEARRACISQVLGLAKYVKPETQYLIDDFLGQAFTAIDRGYLTVAEIEAVIARHEPGWGKYFNARVVRRRRFRIRLAAAKRSLVGLLPPVLRS